MTYEGSAPLCRRIVVIIEVVVVLPCVPVTAIPCRSSITLASADERCSTRSPRCRAATSSGLSGRIAVETTTVSASPTCAASCPTCTVAPAAASSASSGESAESLPDTGTPRASMIRAMPDMPAPPMAMKCTFPRPERGTGSTGVTSPISPPAAAS